MERRLTFFFSFPRLGSNTLQGSPITPATRFNEEMPAYTNRERPEATEAAGGAILSGTLPTGLSPIQTRPHRGLDLQNGSSTTPTPYTRHALHKHSLPRSQLPERERERERWKEKKKTARKTTKIKQVVSIQVEHDVRTWGTNSSPRDLCFAYPP